MYSRKECERVCAICGKTFLAKSGAAKYCPECADKHKKEYQRAYQAAHPPKPKAQVRHPQKTRKECECTCVVCGKTFFAKKKSAKYCLECADKRKKEYNRAYQAKHPHKNQAKLPSKDDPVMEALQNASKITQMELDRQTKQGLVARKCKKCGCTYWVKSGDSYLCPKCAAESRKKGVYQNRVCATCGTTFLGYPRSKYCPTCQAEAKKEASRKCKQRKKAGAVREIGSTDICQNCGKPYVVTSGLQRYCPDCSKYVVQDNVRAHKREYMEQNREYFNAYHQKMRSQRRVCVICGKTFDSPTCTKTCCADCEAELRRRTRTRAQVKAGRAKPVRLLGPRGPVNPQSGVPGVHYHPKSGKWELVIDGKYCGLYDTVSDASKERDKILNQQEATDGGI